jgi:hypothetical protein
MSVENDIRNVELLTNIFGRFPSFHDAEVLSLALERGERDISGPTLETRIHVFEMTSEVDENKRLVLKNHSIVRFRFSEIIDLEINEFNHQNVLSGLYIERNQDQGSETPLFKVTFEGIYGMHADFHCRGISVESVEPYER